LAAMELLEKDHAMQRVRELAPVLENAVHGLRGCKHVLDIRNLGLAAGITLAPYPNEPLRRPFEVALHLWHQGFYVRYGGDTIQMAPPFISTPQEIERLVSAVGDALMAQPD